MVLSTNDLNDRSDGWGHEDNKEPIEDLVRPKTESPEERWARAKVERQNVKADPEDVNRRLGLSEDEAEEILDAEENGVNSVGEKINGKSDYTEGIYANQNGETPDTELNAEHPETSTFNRKTIQSVPGSIADRPDVEGFYKDGDYGVKVDTEVVEGVEDTPAPADVQSSGSEVAAAERTEDPEDLLAEATDGDGEYTENARNDLDGDDAPNKSASKADWQAYAATKNIDTTDMTRDEIIEAVEGK